MHPRLSFPKTRTAFKSNAMENFDICPSINYALSVVVVSIAIWYIIPSILW